MSALILLISTARSIDDDLMRRHFLRSFSVAREVVGSRFYLSCCSSIDSTVESKDSKRSHTGYCATVCRDIAQQKTNLTDFCYY